MGATATGGKKEREGSPKNPMCSSGSIVSGASTIYQGLTAAVLIKTETAVEKGLPTFSCGMYGE